MSFSKVKSYAKVNLALNVTGKLIKLHKIESIVTFISLHDLIIIKKLKSKNHLISFNGRFSKNIKKNNTVKKLFDILDRYKLLNNRKFQVKIKKNVPQEAGLGGGSMNAANILNFLIKKKFIKLKQKKILKISRLIGSDVILGINPSNSILSSNGEIKKFKKKFIFYTLIAQPRFGCSTKYVFSKVRSFSKPKFNFPRQYMFNKSYLKNLNNDLEIIVFKKYPKLKKIKSFLLTIPNTIFVNMSGSGSSIVAYFQSKKACNLALNQFKRKFNSIWCIASKTI